VITGVEKLLGALVIAAITPPPRSSGGIKADGVTEISRVYHIDRGYEHP
jgi:UDP-N-acetylglucosamine enolpyruvyl transferase